MTDRSEIERLLNQTGRTPEEIKQGLWRCLQPAGSKCVGCPYKSSCVTHPPQADALDLIQHLESERNAALAKVPKWIGVEERKPKGFVSVQVYMTDAGDFPSVREGYYVDEDCFYIPALHEFHPVSHWKPFDEPPEEDE